MGFCERIGLNDIAKALEKVVGIRSIRFGQTQEEEALII